MHKRRVQPAHAHGGGLRRLPTGPGWSSSEAPRARMVVGVSHDDVRDVARTSAAAPARAKASRRAAAHSSLSHGLTYVR